MVGSPFSTDARIVDIIVGSIDEADWSQLPSMNSTEFGERRDKLDTPGKIVTEEVRFSRSMTSGSVGLDTPRT